MKPPPESVVLAQCLQYLRLSGVFCWRNANAGILRTDARTGRTWRQFSGEPGSSDILGILRRPGCSCGILLAVETKRQGGKLTPDQAAFLDRVRQEGGLGLVIRDVKELQEALEREGVV